MFPRSRKTLAAIVAGLVTILLGSSASAANSPGAPGIGDPYYPGDGNGGYDVSHYDIRLTYDPASDLLYGTTTIIAKATQDLALAENLIRPGQSLVPGVVARVAP